MYRKCSEEIEGISNSISGSFQEMSMIFLENFTDMSRKFLGHVRKHSSKCLRNLEKHAGEIPGHFHEIVKFVEVLC